MKYKSEIGSEFWLDPDDEMIRGLLGSKHEHTFFLLSGRTALDYIIRDIKAKRTITSAYIPSYCCEAMIEPFARNGIDVKFYEIRTCNDGFQPTYEDDNNCDVVLLLDYFGYENSRLITIANSAKNKGKVVIYDATHKLNGHLEVEVLADYTFCSYRKWFFSNAASIRKNGEFWIKTQSVRNIKYEKLRNKAAMLKHDYFIGLVSNKESYRNLFSEAEDLLDRDYINYIAEPASVDRLQYIALEYIATKRRDNVQHLIDGLISLGYNWLTVPYRNVKQTDFPLFVPIIIDAKLRDTIRQKLIEYAIYCPVHWPLSKFHNFGAGSDSLIRIYLSELSLLCDQRYSLIDMDRMLDTLKSIGDAI